MLASQALKAVYSLKKSMYHYYDPKPRFMYDMFNKLIKPVLMYGSEEWGFHSAAAVKRVHTAYCKIILS